MLEVFGRSRRAAQVKGVRTKFRFTLAEVMDH